jgi:hypothetical protein
MAAVRINELSDLPNPRKKKVRRPGPVPVAIPAPRLGSRPAGPSCRPENNNPAADKRLRVAVVAVGVVVPLAVLAMCLCLPRRERVGTPKSQVVEQPLVAVVPAVVPVANGAGAVDRAGPELLPKEPPADQQLAAPGRNVATAVEEGKPAGDIPELPPARVEKPLAALALPPRTEEPELPLAPPQPDKAAVREGCPKTPAGEYGTAVHFARDPAEAAKLAKADDKLMVVFTISGNFEDSKFT